MLSSEDLVFMSRFCLWKNLLKTFCVNYWSALLKSCNMTMFSTPVNKWDMIPGVPNCEGRDYKEIIPHSLTFLLLELLLSGLFSNTLASCLSGLRFKHWILCGKVGSLTY